MKRILFIATVLAAFVATDVAAQNAQGLDLTDEQREQIQELLQSNRAETNAAIASILTDEQKDAIVARAITGQFQRRAVRARPGVRARTGGRTARGFAGRSRSLLTDRMAAELELTDEQREKIRTIMSEQRAQGAGSAREAIREVLTEEQVQKLDEMREQRVNRGAKQRQGMQRRRR